MALESKTKLGDREEASPEPAAPKNTTAVGDKLQDPPGLINGWRLHVCMTGLCSALVLSSLETTIVSTSLPTIGTYFHDYGQVGWIVTAYLVTYSSFLLSTAKLSDIFTQRNVLLSSLLLFAVASGLCAASERINLTSLIVFRALQGVGGSGIFSVVFVTLFDICPARLLGLYSSVVSSTFAVANVLGPILGGAICESGDWKWVFLLNVPGSAVAGALIYVALPRRNKDSAPVTTTAESTTTTLTTKSLIRHVDFVGSLLSIGGAVMIIYSLQAGGSDRPWSDAEIIGTLVAGAVTIVLFFAYEYLLTRNNGAAAAATIIGSKVEPVFPFRLLRNLNICLLLLITFFHGGVFYSTIVLLPQHNQIVHLRNPTRAGIDILPIMVLSPFASFIAGVVFSKTTRFGGHMLAVGAALTLLGIGLLIEVPFIMEGILARQYGYEAILGVGLGVLTPAVLVMGRLEVHDGDNAVIMGALNATRAMGGCICLSICSAVLNSQRDEKLGFLPKPVLEGISLSPTSAIAGLPPEEAQRTREAFFEIFRLQRQVEGVWKEHDNRSSVSFIVEPHVSGATLTFRVPGLVEGTVVMASMDGNDQGLPHSEADALLCPDMYYLRPIGLADAKADLVFHDINGAAGSSREFAFTWGRGGMDRCWTPFSWPQLLCESYFRRANIGPYNMQLMRILSTEATGRKPYATARLWKGQKLVCAAQQAILPADLERFTQDGPVPDQDAVIVEKVYENNRDGPGVTGAFRDKNVGYVVHFIGRGKEGERWRFETRHTQPWWNMPTSPPGPNATGNSAFLDTVSGGAQGEAWPVGTGGSGQLEL